MGLIILIGSLYWLQGYRLERNSRLIRVHFADVGSLAVGDKVTVSGVYRGKVDRFDLLEDGVLVELLISREVSLKRDATFAIKNMGVMGERFIAISPGTDSLPLDTTAVAYGRSDTGIPEIMGLLGETITELRALIGTFRENVQTQATLEKFNATLTNLEQVTSSMAAFLERHEGSLDRTAENLHDATGRLSRLVADNADAIDSTLGRFDRASLGLERFVGQLDTVAISVRAFTDVLGAEEGTLQLMAEDRRLYDDLRQTANNLDELIADIRENPQKYINLKVELF
jgi:phospholipid/cholesterol/gamma-HCH transport system substrate-binding protein